MTLGNESELFTNIGKLDMNAITILYGAKLIVCGFRCIRQIKTRTWASLSEIPYKGTLLIEIWSENVLV